MGQDTRSLFQYLKDEGWAFLIGGFHVKGHVVDSRGVSAWGYGTLGRGDWKDGRPSPSPAEAAAAMHALQHEVLASQGIPVQAFGREAYRS
jgi:hypothetical protein